MATKGETINYMRGMAAGLAEIAHKQKLPTLALIFSMAEMEAATLAEAASAGLSQPQPPRVRKR